MVFPFGVRYDTHFQTILPLSKTKVSGELKFLEVIFVQLESLKTTFRNQVIQSDLFIPKRWRSLNLSKRSQRIARNTFRIQGLKLFGKKVTFRLQASKTLQSVCIFHPPPFLGSKCEFSGVYTFVTSGGMDCFQKDVRSTKDTTHRQITVSVESTKDYITTRNISIIPKNTTYQRNLVVFWGCFS